jgi:hypothetical protein
MQQFLFGLLEKFAAQQDARLVSCLFAMFISNSRIFQTVHLLWAFLIPLYQDVLSNDKMTFRGGKLQVSLLD